MRSVHERARVRGAAHARGGCGMMGGMMVALGTMVLVIVVTAWAIGRMEP